MEQSDADSNNLTNNSPSDPVKLDSACETHALEPVSEGTSVGPLLPPYWNADHSQFATSDSCLNDDYPGIPSSSPTKQQNGEQAPTSSQVSTTLLVEISMNVISIIDRNGMTTRVRALESQVPLLLCHHQSPRITVEALVQFRCPVLHVRLA